MEREGLVFLHIGLSLFSQHTMIVRVSNEDCGVPVHAEFVRSKHGGRAALVTESLGHQRIASVST